MDDQKSIVALASGTLPCAIAVVRVSGSQCAYILDRFIDSPPPPRQFRLRAILDPVTRIVIDKGLVVSFPAPASFTGEDCLEFHVHGSRAVVNRLLTKLLEIPLVRAAEPGEFARRAFKTGVPTFLELNVWVI